MRRGGREGGTEEGEIDTHIGERGQKMRMKTTKGRGGTSFTRRNILEIMA